MYRKKMYRKYMVFGAGILTIFILCSTAIAMCAASNPSNIPNVWIGEVIVEWDNSMFGSGWPKCYLNDESINISTNNNDIDIYAGLNCSMFFCKEMMHTRIVVYQIILHLDSPDGRIIGSSLPLSLRGTNGKHSGVIITKGEYGSSENETRYIWCEVITTPYIELFGSSFFRFKWGEQVTCFSSIECIITHTD